jgi:probable rRNA maturation factor
LSVILLEDRGIQAVHRDLFGEATPTDVITQPYRPVPPAIGWSGEIYVNAQRAAEEGRRRSGGAARELALYVIHGCLHLGGETDAHPKGRARMRRLEQTRLRIAEREGLLSALLRPHHA